MYTCDLLLTHFLTSCYHTYDKILHRVAFLLNSATICTLKDQLIPDC